jgi:hypothetical protein
VRVHRRNLRVDERHAPALRARGERVRFEAGTRRHRHAVWMYLVVAPDVREYVLVGTSGSDDLILMPQAELAALEGS